MRCSLLFLLLLFRETKAENSILWGVREFNALTADNWKKSLFLIWFLKVWGDVNNPDSPSAPSYITADCGNVLTAFTQCLELENIFTYCKAITTNLVPLTSRYTSNDFISLTTINLSVRPTKKKMETWWWEVCRLPGTSGTFLFYVTFWTRQHSFSGDLSLYERYVFFFFLLVLFFSFFFFFSL